MLTLRKLSLAVAFLALTLVLSSCYYQDAIRWKAAGQPVPWWCTSTEEIPVTTGPAVGTVDWYAGTHKAPLSWDRLQDDVGAVRPGQGLRRSSGRPQRRPRPTAGAWPRRTSPAWAPTTSAAASRPRCWPTRPSTGRTRSSTPPGSTTCSTRPSPRCSSTTATARREARRLRLLRADQHRPAARGLPGQQRLVAPPPDDLLPHDRRGDDRVQHLPTPPARRRAAST